MERSFYTNLAFNTEWLSYSKPITEQTNKQTEPTTTNNINNKVLFSFYRCANF